MRDKYIYNQFLVTEIQRTYSFIYSRIERGFNYIICIYIVLHSSDYEEWLLNIISRFNFRTKKRVGERAVPSYLNSITYDICK
jgi:hypothetical protein